VTTLEIVRAVWTVSTGVGTLIMLWLLREALVDNWAISQVHRSNGGALRIITRGEVEDQAVRVASVFCLCAAGALSYFMQPTLVIALLVLSAFAQVTLGIIKLHRRRRLFDTLKLTRKAQ
jgi:hypothetical protein